PAVAGNVAHARLVLAARFAAVVGVYFGAAKLGLDLSVAHGVITPVWAPTGIALAALVLFGSRLCGSSWFLWWVGDSMGDLIVAPLLFVLATVTLRRILRVEAAALLALVVGLSCFVFLAGYWRYP